MIAGCVCEIWGRADRCHFLRTAPTCRGSLCSEVELASGYISERSSWGHPSTTIVTSIKSHSLIKMLRPICKHASRPFSASIRSATIGRRHMTTPVSFDWKDPLNANSLLTEEEQAISETAESYCQERMLPRVLGKCGQPC